MFCLAHKVGGKICGVCGVICYDKYFAGTCYHIYIHLAVKKLLGGGYKDIAGTYYLIDLGYLLRAVCKSSNCLCSSAHKYPVNSHNGCCSEDIGIGLAVLAGRCYHNYFFYACNPCRNGVHKH